MQKSPPVANGIDQPAAPIERSRAGPRAALAVREFRYLYAAGALSGLGDQLTRIALSVLIYAETHSAALTGLTYALTFVPNLVGGALLAGLADRYPRRTVMIVSDLLRAVFMVVLAVSALPVWALNSVLVLAVLSGAPFAAASVAALPPFWVMRSIRPGRRCVN